MTDFVYINKGGGGVFRKGQLGPIGQGTVGIDLVVQVLDLAQAAVTLTGFSTITGRLENQANGDVIPIDGTMTLVDAGAGGQFTWVVSANDSGTDGLFWVVFKLTNGTDTYITLPTEMLITDNPAISASSGPPLIGITQAASDWLDDEITAVGAATDGEILQSDGMNSEGSGITAVELNAVLGTGGTDNFVWTADAIGGAGWEAAAGGVAAIDDLTDVTIDGTPADNEVLAYNTGTSQWINQTAAEAGLSAASHVHAAGDVTSGTFADALIAQSNVTQHQAALSIASGQVTGLGTLATQSGTFSGGGTFASAGFTLTLSGNGGTLALGGFTLTVPATGTAVLLSETQTITGNKSFTGELSSPGAAASSVKVGIGATAAGSSGVAIGDGATASGGFSTAIGKDAIASQTSSIAIGVSAVSSITNTLVIGANGRAITHAYIGGGVTAAAPIASFTLTVTGGSGTNIAATALHLAGGRGTGNAATGRVVLQNSIAGASGSTLQTLKDRWSLEAAGDLAAWQESSSATRQVLGVVPTLPTATDASRKGRAVFNVYDTVAREAMVIEASGTAAMIGFLGAAAVVRAAHIADPSGGGTQDAEARTAINAILVILENLGFKATS